MAHKPRSGASYKAQYKTYKNTNQWEKNKVRRLEARLRENPADIGAQKALDEVMSSKNTYNRNNFKNKGWFHPQEQKLLKNINHEVLSIAQETRTKLAVLNSVQHDEKPSPLKFKPLPKPEPVTLIVDQLFNIGIINEKRRNTFKSRMGRVRKGRPVSNRRGV